MLDSHLYHGICQTQRIHVDDVAYIVSAGLLLPTNSAFNPLLYSSLLDKLKETFKKLRNNMVNQQEIVELNNVN